MFFKVIYIINNILKIWGANNTEHLEHFIRNNVEEKKIATISLKDHRHVSLAQTQFPVPALLSSKGKERHFTTQPVHTSASIGILASPWYQRAAHSPGVCKLSLWWLFGAGMEWETCPLGIHMPTGQVFTGHLAPAFHTPRFFPSVWSYWWGRSLRLHKVACSAWLGHPGRKPCLAEGSGSLQDFILPLKILPAPSFLWIPVYRLHSSICFRTVPNVAGFWRSSASWSLAL